MVAGVAEAHRRLERAIEQLGDDEVRSASLLDGWTIGHVLSHLARNAESFGRLIEGSRRGEELVQYPGGPVQRNGDIEAGALRSAAEILDDVRTQNAALETCWAAGIPEGRDDLPLRRWREVEVHHADLGLGRTYEDWSPDYLRRELRQLTMLWDSRRPMGMTGLPAVALALPEPVRLGWLLGRIAVDGLEPAGLMP